MRFAAVGGRAELWVDGVRVADKAGYAPAPIDARIAPGGGTRRIVLLVEADVASASGVMGPVTLSAL